MQHTAGDTNPLLSWHIPRSKQPMENHISMPPPELPVDHIYTRCYCEENVYLLCQQFLDRRDVRERWEVWVVFISNETKTVALWEQKNACEAGAAVVWDYHVILVLKARRKTKYYVQQQGMGEPPEVNKRYLEETEQVGAWVYDYDTSITPMPCRLSEYITRTFPYEPMPRYQSLFRVIPGEEFIGRFASDRSHMLLPGIEGQPLGYISPPPIYDPICGELSRKAGVANNLMQSFVCMIPVAENTFGNVLGLEEVLSKFYSRV